MKIMTEWIDYIQGQKYLKAVGWKWWYSNWKMKNSLGSSIADWWKERRKARTSGHEHRAIEIFLSEHTKILKINEQSMGFWGQYYIYQDTDDSLRMRRVWDTGVENSQTWSKNTNWNSWKSKVNQ